LVHKKQAHFDLKPQDQGQGLQAQGQGQSNKTKATRPRPDPKKYCGKGLHRKRNKSWETGLV